MQIWSDSHLTKIGFLDALIKMRSFESHFRPYVWTTPLPKSLKCICGAVQVNDGGKIWVFSMSCGLVMSRLWYLICIFTGNSRQPVLLNIWYKRREVRFACRMNKAKQGSAVISAQLGYWIVSVVRYYCYQRWVAGIYICFSEQLGIANVKIIRK